ncbi:hypothetical protein [Microvirga flavescens]|uniref:hypothetical protein n=1 Tax=Microvirga flavescens TaxID=2249811 RepID=UPI0013001740|nr:hypothetical protein [Microvirga flavescens]
MSTKPQIDWDRIESFIGYGRHDAPVVFIGMEEGLASDQDLEEDLIRRSTYDPVIELQGGARKGQRTWRAMCDLMLRREGIIDLSSGKRNEYQAKKLGIANGDTLLTELLPYPHNKATDWLYSPYGRYSNRDEYLKGMLPKRIAMLRDLIQQFRREIIVCYGKERWDHYKKLFEGTPWRKQGLFEIADDKGTRIVLAPHFSGRAFNTNEQLAEMARVALGN